MVARASTVPFQGIEGVPVDVQVMVAPARSVGRDRRTAGQGGGRKRERVQRRFMHRTWALPAKRVTVNLARRPTKEGSHFDLAIALG